MGKLCLIWDFIPSAAKQQSSTFFLCALLPILAPAAQLEITNCDFKFKTSLFAS